MSCPICARETCTVLNHDRLENDAQAMSFARKIVRDPSSDHRHALLANWIICALAAKKHGGR